MTASLFGDTKLSQMLGGYMPPRRRFDLDVQRCNAEGAPVVVHLQLAVRALSVEEMEQSHADAVKWLVGVGGHQREDLITSNGDSVVELEMMTQVLARALMDPDKPREPFAKDAKALRETFYPDEIETCFREFSAFDAERSPLRRLRSADDLAEVVEALGKGQTSQINLLRFDIISLRSITLSLADRVAKQTRPNSSATSQPSASLDDSSAPTGSMTISEE